MSKALDHIQGSCLCGKVSFRLKGSATAFDWCHCSRCRKSTGTAHAANIFTDPGNITWISGEAYIKRFDLPEAKVFAKQFCTHCGSPLPVIIKAGTKLMIPAGSIHSEIPFPPDDNIFWGSKAPWYEAGRESIKYDEYPC